MRASRLLSILMLLQTRGRTTADALAAEFEVSVRTIYRDIDQLSAADVPIYGDRGPNGGFQLLDGYRTKLTGLSPAEAETLFLAGLPGPAADLGLADVLATAELKLTAALPERVRPQARRLAARFHLDPVDWFRSPDEARLLPAIAQSVWNETRVEIRYRRGTGAVTRLLNPLGLVLKAGTWYVVASVGQAMRTYRVSNILTLTQTAEPFPRPKDFDLVGYWTAATRSYELGLYRGEAVLKVRRKSLPRLELLGAAVKEAADRTARPAGRDWLRVQIPIESPEQAAAELLRLGPEVEVIEPEALRSRIGERAEAVARLYRPPARQRRRT
jgi:predicted DNA-binding transcriptional regulator YafY